jgi:WD40 repeat protein
MRVLLAVLLIGVVGCGGEDNLPDDVAVPLSPTISQVQAMQKSAAKKFVEGQEALTLKGHADQIWRVSFSPDGKRIVSGSDDNTLKVWDISLLDTSK